MANPWVELIQSTPKSYYTSFLSSKEIFLEVKEFFRMKTLVELVQTTSKVILPISAEFQGDFPGSETVIRVNPWVELVQSTPKVILHIFSEWVQTTTKVILPSILLQEVHQHVKRTGGSNPAPYSTVQDKQLQSQTGQSIN